MITRNEFDEFIQKYGTPSAIILGCLLIAASVYISFGLPNQKLANKTAPSPVVSGERAAAAGQVEVSADDDAFLGSSTAPVTVVEFSDFQCPFCRKFWREALPEIKKNYIDTGKVKLVYRDFPLSIHPMAEGAAESAECAREQGKFWEMHDKIFAEQEKEGAGTIQFETADLKRWAREIGLATADFNNCLDSGKYKDEVAADFAAGGLAGVTGTPATFVNGRLVRGAVPFSVFAKAIDEELAKSE